MKRNHPAKRLTAALLSGAMLLGLCVPALAAGADAVPAAAPAALSEENSADPPAADETLILTWHNTTYTLTPNSHDISSASSVSLPTVSYENGVYKIKLPDVSSAIDFSFRPSLALQGKGSQLPAVELVASNFRLGKLDVTNLNGFSADSVDVYSDAAFTNPGDVTITDGLSPGSSCMITGAHDVKISNSNGAAVNGSTTTTSAKFSVDASGDVIITSTNDSAIRIYKTEINAGGKAEINADGGNSSDICAIHSDISSVTARGDVSIVSNGLASGYNNAFAIYGGSSTISAGGNVKISSETARAVWVRDSFAIKKAHNVDITGCDRAVYVSGDGDQGSSFTVDATGDVKIHGNDTADSGSTFNSAFGIQSDTISIQTTGAVSISTDGSGAAVQQASINSSSSTFTVDAGGDVKIQGGDTSISCRHAVVSSGGTVDISSVIDAAYFEIEKAQDVKIISETGSAIDNYSSTIHCSGNVEIKGLSDAIDTNQFAIDQAKDVTITSTSGSVFSGCSSSTGSVQYHNPTASIVCSGTVELTAGSGKALVCEDTYDSYDGEEAMLVYRPTADSTEYAVYAGSSAAAAAKLDGVGAAGTSYSVSSRMNNASSEDGAAPAFYSYVKIIPDLPEPVIPEPEDPNHGTDDGAGALVAGALLSGAAVWGGYELATRAILNDLLPEGAAIPANRGQLALLVWNTAGRPAPAAAPAFADVTDPDTAAAAQWCVEQGYLDAKDGSFRPDGWTPKFRVIDVWNKAFPKQ